MDNVIDFKAKKEQMENRKKDPMQSSLYDELEPFFINLVNETNKLKPIKED